MKENKQKKKRVVKKHEHDFEIEQCDFCGHTEEMCLKCWKGRCSEIKSNKLENPYV